MLLQRRAARCLVLAAPLVMVQCFGDAESGDSGSGGSPHLGGGAATGGGDSGGASSGGVGTGGVSTGGETTGGAGERGLGGGPAEAGAFITVWNTNPWGRTEDLEEIEAEVGVGAFRSISLPLLGMNYALTVDWGDGTTSEIANKNDPDRHHVYATSGEYVVTIDGTVRQWAAAALEQDKVCVETNGDPEDSQCIETFEYREADKLLEVRQWGGFRFGAQEGAFEGATNLVITAEDVPGFSTGATLERAFGDCSSLTDVPGLEHWPTGGVTSMAYMFLGATSFRGPLAALDVSAVTDMRGMFGGATSFNRSIAAWDTSQVEDMSEMFNAATSFDRDISAWSTTRVNYMLSMFAGATKFNQDISAWDVSGVSEMTAMFYGATKFNQDISSWDVSRVRKLDRMFLGAVAFNQDISSWETIRANDTSQMFSGATSFNQDISSWNTGTFKDVREMFFDATAFDQNLAAWNMEGMSYADRMFEGSGLSTENYDALLIGWASKTVRSNVNFGAQGIQYTSAAAAARADLIAGHAWVIVDGGLLP